MTQLTPDLAPLFWAAQEAQGLTPEDVEAGRVTDLGRRLCEFMDVHAPRKETIIEMPIQKPELELSQAS